MINGNQLGTQVQVLHASRHLTNGTPVDSVAKYVGFWGRLRKFLILAHNRHFVSDTFSYKSMGLMTTI
ncbi:hypothetical protein BDR06DRAFT_959188 [Suillus hirtellus]|nr:hypothetical protein BDR06DRAFT_959188 [Suillus hirtellus]